MLSLLKKRSSIKGLTCVGLEPNGFTLAHVLRDDEGRPQLQVCDYRPHTEGEELVREIGSVISEYGLRGAAGICVLHPSSYSLRLVDAPDVGPEYVKEAARYSIADLIDYDVDEAVIDVIEIADQAVSARGLSIYVVAAPAPQIQETADLIHDSGLKLQAIDIPEMALRNISALLPEDADGLALMHLRPEGGMITLCREGKLFLARHIEGGLNQLHEIGAADPSDDNLYPSHRAQEIFDSLLLEVQRSLDYYEHQLGQSRTNNLMIAPLEKEIPALVDYLSENLSVNVRMLNLSEALESQHEIARDLQARCLTTIGGALRVEAMTS